MRLAIAAIAIAVLGGSLVLVSEAAYACDSPGLVTGSCTDTDASTTDTTVDVTATETTPDTDTSTTPPQVQTRSKHKKPPPPPLKGNSSRIIVTTGSPITNVVCTAAQFCPEPPVQPPPEGPGQGPVTIEDIASFHPSTATTGMEPNGWAVVGLDANPYSGAEVHVIVGQLLGQPAEVRFTPTAWHWDYGDGTSRDSTTAGGSWKALGVAEFSRTATSHAYAQPGTFTVTPRIRFAAEYRFDGGDWIPIDGAVNAVGDPVAVVVGTASTVLVAADCSTDPTSPGC